MGNLGCDAAINLPLGFVSRSSGTSLLGEEKVQESERAKGGTIHFAFLMKYNEFHGLRSRFNIDQDSPY